MFFGHNCQWIYTFSLCASVFPLQFFKIFLSRGPREQMAGILIFIVHIILQSKPLIVSTPISNKLIVTSFTQHLCWQNWYIVYINRPDYLLTVLRNNCGRNIPPHMKLQENHILHHSHRKSSFRLNNYTISPNWQT